MYGVEDWKDDEDFLEKLAFRKGKLKKGAEADIVATAKIVLMDWQRGELPFFTLPPGAKQEPTKQELKQEEYVEPLFEEEGDAEEGVVEMEEEEGDDQ